MLTYRLTSTTGDIGVDHDEHGKSEPNHTGTATLERHRIFAHHGAPRRRRRVAELTLEMAGLLDLYAGVFDLNRYRRARSTHVVEILGGTDEPAREIRAFAVERGVSFTPAESIRGAAIRASRTVANRIPPRLRWALAHPLWAGRKLLDGKVDSKSSA